MKFIVSMYAPRQSLTDDQHARSLSQKPAAMIETTDTPEPFLPDAPGLPEVLPPEEPQSGVLAHASPITSNHVAMQNVPVSCIQDAPIDGSGGTGGETTKEKAGHTALRCEEKHKTELNCWPMNGWNQEFRPSTEEARPLSPTTG